MLQFPNINPIAFSIGPLQIHWYGLMYLLGFACAWGLAHWRTKHYQLHWSPTEISDLIFFTALGVILGGRLGYMLFYNTQSLLDNPLNVFKIWEGGMSFHGGLIGVLLALMLFAKKVNKSFWEVADFLAPLVPFGLAAGRIGNFINGELWGRTTQMPWGMVFPQADGQPRHPSQLYEAGLEGLGLFVLIWWYAARPRPRGSVSAMFLIGYAICRIMIEYFREPDAQLGFVAFERLTMGQILSIPMLIGGLLLLWWSKCNDPLSRSH